MAKQKAVTMRFTPREIGRGEWGKQFYISTFRFPLKEAQKMERRAASIGLTLSSLVNQLVMCFNETVPEPEVKVKLARTSQPTVWGAVAKKQFFKAKGLPVPVKRAAVKAVKAKAVKAKPMSSMMAKLKALRASQEEAA